MAEWTTRRPSVKSRARRGYQKDGDLRSDRVLGREATHPFHGGHRRHDHRVSRWAQAARSGLEHRRHGQFFVGRNPPLLRTPPNGFLDGGVANRMPFPSPVRACKRGAHVHPPLRGRLKAGGHRWRPAVRSRARSGDYPSVSQWAQAARSEGHKAARSRGGLKAAVAG